MLFRMSAASPRLQILLRTVFGVERAMRLVSPKMLLEGPSFKSQSCIYALPASGYGRLLNRIAKAAPSIDWTLKTPLDRAVACSLRLLDFDTV